MVILGKDSYFNNSYKQNANNLVIGAPGTGKSRSFVIPNLCEASEESVVVLDAKGEIYDITHVMMESKGYKVKVLDFDTPENTQVYYNPLSYCKNEEDVIKLSSIITSDQKERTVDAFWPLASQLLNNALVSFLITYRPENQRTLSSVMKLLGAANINENDPDSADPLNKLDAIFAETLSMDPTSWSCMQYNLMRKGAGRTQKSIVISLIVAFCAFMTPAVSKLTSKDTVDIRSLGSEKTALYVKCSDVDRSKDKLVSMFFMQLFQELFRVADSQPTHSLQRSVHVILDDMGSNVKIPNLDCIIASARGRNISLSLILQSIGQLKKNYADYTSILNSCNNILFLGGNDVETCKEMSLRLNKPLEDVLYKSKDKVYIFKQGAQKPIVTDIYNLKEHRYYSLLQDNWRSDTDANTKFKHEREECL
ncbi:MAG: type IV secretory system conjugative DNA transfer family protein [Ruminococcus sp.]|nr:type IV secretory system conjugative DNA transfer family protein [Ruminococcus sp.]